MPATPIERQLEEERRSAVFAWLDGMIRQHGEVLPFALLAQGAPFQGARQPVLHRQKGIYKPAGSPVALSLRTSSRDRYGDRFDGQDTLIYRMERSGPEGEDNRAARRAFADRLPLVYLHQVAKGPPARFAVVHPVWIVGVDAHERAFRVETRPFAGGELNAVDEGRLAPFQHTFERALERRYATRLIRTRLHQAGFRERVLAAYQTRCAMCRLGEARLLDAAHIDPDAQISGEPVTSNGLALCRIHHAAFDAHLVSIEPDPGRVRIHPRLLEQSDGPMLLHGLQGLEGVEIARPRRPADRPDPERLGRHWRRFLEQAG